MFKKHVSLRSSKPDISQLSTDAIIELTETELEDATGGYYPPDHRHYHYRYRHYYYDRYHHRHYYDTYD